MKSKQSRRDFLRATVSGVGLAALPALATERPALAFDNTTFPNLHDLPKKPDSSIHDAVKLAIKSLVDDGLDDIFPRPFELALLARDPALQQGLFSSTVAWLEHSGHTGRRVLPAHTVLMPKHVRNECRRCTLLDPRDSVRYLALGILVARAIEPLRLPRQTRRVLSYRYDPQGSSLFAPDFDGKTLHEETLARLADDRTTWLVRTDIKDFYSNITRDCVGGALRRCEVDTRWIDALLEMLGSWEASTSPGIPTGPMASHILAEAVLIDIDKGLIDDGINFIRFVDDYRMFAPDATTAREWIAKLAHRLAAKSLALRADKTYIDVSTKSGYSAALVYRNLGPLAATSEPKPKCPPDTYRCRPKPPPPKSVNDDLELVDAPRLFAKLKAVDRIDPRDFRLFLEAGYHRREFSLIADATELLDRSPQSVVYLTALLVQESFIIPHTTRRALARTFGASLNARNPIADYEVISIATLLGNSDYRNPEAILQYLQSKSDRTSPVVARFLLEALDGQVDASTANLLRARYDAAEPWLRRAVTRLALPHLSMVERSELHELEQKDGDPFLQSLLADRADLAS